MDDIIHTFPNPEIEPLPKKPYSDYLVDGAPIWEVEHRGMTEEEAEAFKAEVERLRKNGGNGNGKSKAAEAAEANLSGNGIMPE